MKIRVTKTANINPETLKTETKKTLYHLYIDFENGEGEQEKACSPDTATMQRFIEMYKDFDRQMNGGNK